MILQVAYYAAAALGGWMVGNTVVDTVSKATEPAQSVVSQLPQYYSQVPHVVEPSFSFSPFMLLSLAVVAIAIAYAIKSIVISIRSWMSSSNSQDDERYYR